MRAVSRPGLYAHAWRSRCFGFEVSVSERSPGRSAERHPLSLVSCANATTRSGKLEYRASIAQWQAELAARRPKTAKLASNAQLHGYVQDRLAGLISRADGQLVAVPMSPGSVGVGTSRGVRTGVGSRREP